MKVLLASVFLFIFSFQVSPIKEIGKILFKGQMTEEVHENNHDTDDTTLKVKKTVDPFYTIAASYIAQVKYIDTKILAAIHHSERLPVQHMPDITTPPPNCI